MRKVGFITKFNEFGEEVRDIVPEQYKPNKQLGEEVSGSGFQNGMKVLE